LYGGGGAAEIGPPRRLICIPAYADYPVVIAGAGVLVVFDGGICKEYILFDYF